MSKRCFMLFFIFAFCLAIHSIKAQNPGILCKKWQSQLDSTKNLDLQIRLCKETVSKVDSACKVEVYAALGTIYFKKNLDSALYFSDKAMRLIQHTTTEAETIIKIFSQRAFILIKKERSEEAKILLQKCRQQLSEYPDSDHWTSYYNTCAKLADKNTDYRQAIAYLDSGIMVDKNTKRLPNPSLYQNKGVYYIRLSDYENAAKSLLKALELKEKYNHTGHTISNTLYLLGACYVRLNHFELANQYFKKCIAMSRESGNDYGLTVSYLRMGNAYRKMSQPNDALNAIDSALIMAQKIKDDYQIAEGWREKGYVYFKNFERYDEAEKYLVKAYEIVKKTNVDIQMVSCIEGVIEIYLHKKAYKKVLKYIEHLKQVSSRLNIPTHTEKLHQFSSEYYENVGQPALALQHYKKYYAIKDSISNQKVQTKVADLEKKYDTKKKALAIAALNQEKEAQKQIALQAKFRQNLYLIAAVFLMIALGIGTWFFLKLRKQQKALASANQIKNRLFSIIGHDLRGMIIPFQRAGKVLKYHIERGNYDKTVALSEELEKNSESLSNMLDNLLSWSLEQMNGYTINPEQISVKEQLEEIIDGFEQQAHYKNTKINLSYDDAFSIKLDKGAFHIIFRNLIGNALKYTENGIITVSFKGNAEGFTCLVNDTGVGMTAEQLENIFSLIKGETTTGTRGEKGTGIGLNLVHRFVEMNKGTIQAYSEKGIGTCFELFFPTAVLVETAQTTNQLEPFSI